MKAKLLLILLLALTLTGCATQKNSLLTHLQMRVGELERQLEVRDEQVKELNYGVKDLSYEIDRLKTKCPRTDTYESSARNTATAASKSSDSETGIIRVPASTAQIQEALKGAGFYDGPIDNKIGARTKSAIMNFQKENGLKSDGIVGQKTWTELKTYLN